MVIEQLTRHGLCQTLPIDERINVKRNVRSSLTICNLITRSIPKPLTDTQIEKQIPHTEQHASSVAFAIRKVG